ATLRIAFLSALVLELLATLGVALVAVGVGLRLVYGDMTLAAGLTALLLAPEGFWPLRRVGMEFHAAQDGKLAAGKAFQLIDSLHPEVNTARLRDVDLEPGVVTVVTGPNGAGKTTMLHDILGLDSPQPREWWRTVAWLDHRPVLVPGSIRHNLELF